MATYTTTLALRKPAGTDYVSRVLDINNNLDSIDALFHPTTGHTHSGAGTNGTVVALNEAQVIYDAAEAATLDTLTGASKLINNMNRIRYWLTQISGQGLGTVTTSLNAHAIAAFGHSGITAFATPALGLSTAAAAGAATTVIRSDATLAIFDATAATTLSATASATGSQAFAARRDHVHYHGTLAPITNAHGMADMSGTISDTQHGTRTVASAHGMAQITGTISTTQHGALGAITNAHAAADITNAAALNANASFTAQYVSAGSAIGNSGAAFTVNWNNGNVQTVTANSASTATFSNPLGRGRYMLIVTQDATGGRVFTWPASVKWPGNVVPTPSGPNKVDLYGFAWDGTNYYGSVVLNY